VARQAVHLSKYGNKPGLAKALGCHLGEAVVTALTGGDRPLAEERGSPFDPSASSGLGMAAGAFDLVVPVPLTRRRLAKRGYNQAERIAHGIVERTGWPLDRRSLVRIHWRRSQTTLDGADRLANVAGAFEVRNPERLAGARVLLVDDVVTTGATVGACRESLVGAGAASVTVAAVAYAGSVDMDVPEPEAIAELKRDF
jgi:predicted amidophosphoribosyltransferase